MDARIYFFLLSLLNDLIINHVKNISMLCCAAVFYAVIYILLTFMFKPNLEVGLKK